ncbi:hypothetical protein J7E88_11505 [Streptomyces sp. ISL-10]|uniref:hypothetical protein n=1 Tax=Streptomyces sp. ISL-10 TaxID=2819172 RepID=UPI001BEBD7DF|nr:hypothetical protein [Streptomyces sp. ISL-10]MBT2365914.1 hypothetical protein [Streptomyces sp. ISL-10]
MKILESVRGIAFMASFDQARAFAAACAERTSGVLFWALTEDGREGDREVYLQALEALWEAGPIDADRASQLHHSLTELPDIGPEAHSAGGDALVRIGARLLLAGVAMLISGSPQGAAATSSFARDFARELGRRCETDLLAREDETQNQDVATVLSWADEEPAAHLPALRMAAAGLGRSYLQAAVAERGGTDAVGPSSELRVTAVPDRSEVIAAYAGATRHYGVVGRVASGDDAGRYIRVDKLADLAVSPEERAEAVGVMIRVADDPGMEINCIGEWVEDWAGVEESFRRDGRRVDWGS